MPGAADLRSVGSDRTRIVRLAARGLALHDRGKRRPAPPGHEGLGGGGGRTPSAGSGGSRGRGENVDLLRRRPATVVRSCERVKTESAILTES